MNGKIPINPDSAFRLYPLSCRLIYPKGLSKPWSEIQLILTDMYFDLSNIPWNGVRSHRPYRMRLLISMDDINSGTQRPFDIRHPGAKTANDSVVKAEEIKPKKPKRRS